MQNILEFITKDNIEFFVDNIIPILTLFGAVLGSLAAIYKYFNEKNRDFYMNILKKVYAPLFEELVKMEYSRKHFKKSFDKERDKKIDVDGKQLGKERFSVKHLPFIYLSNTKTSTTWEIGKTPETKIEKKTIYNFDNTLEQLLTEIDFNYAPIDLVSLLKVYSYMENIDGLEGFCLSKEQKKIQRKIRRNIIVGYKKYRKKLGLRDVTVDRFCFIFWGFIFFR